jgi:hypothetical protein
MTAVDVGDPLVAEAAEMTKLLSGKRVKVLKRFKRNELMLEFDGGTRLYVNSKPEGLEFSITG